MARRRLLDRLGIPPELRNTAGWPDIDLVVLPSGKQPRFRRLHDAVKLYMETDRPVKEIAAEAQIPTEELLRFVQRCLTPTNSGQCVGFPALLKYTRLKAYTRTKDSSNSGHSGLFAKLLSDHPELIKWIEDTALGQRTEDAVPERNIALIDLHSQFLDKLSTLGISPHDYPFSVESRGYESLRQYVKGLEADKIDRAANAKYLRKGQHVTGASQNSKGFRLHRPYEFVMADTHAFDCSFVVGIPMPDGVYKPVPINRFGIMTVLDVPSRCVLGYQPMLNRDARGEDLLSAARNAVVPWRPRQLSIADLAYRNGAGFPSGVIPECAWRTWMKLSYDNAQAHLAPLVTKALISEIRCSLNDGIAGVPESRAILERFFRTLESRLGHRIVSTTGSNPSDPRRRAPERKAVRYDIRLDDLLQLIDVTIANYNATQHSAIGKIAPLEYIRLALDHGDLARTIPEAERTNFSLHKLYFEPTVRGDIKNGVRPYINYEGSRYRNSVLANAGRLIGLKIKAVANTEDLRFVDLYLPDGNPLGRTVAQGKWGLVKHTLRQRKMINAGPLRHLSLERGVDPVSALNRELATRATESVRAARAYAQSLLDSNTANTDSVDQAAPITDPLGRMRGLRPEKPVRQNDALIDDTNTFMEFGDTVIH